MAVIETYRTVVQADYFQFYVQAGEAWSSDAVGGLGYEWRLWSKDGFAYIGTGGQYPEVTVTIEGHDAAPGEPGPEWDHVASTSLESAGSVDVCDWDPPPTPPALTIALAAGPWRMRVHGIDLAAADGGEPERTFIQLWPEPWSETTLDRCWAPWERPRPSDTSPDGRRQVEVGEEIQLRCAHLEPVGSFRGREPEPPGGMREYPPMPGGGPGSRCYRLTTDPADGSWWVAGIDVRETVREVTSAEAAALQALPEFEPIPADHLAAWREHRARQRRR